MRCSTVSYCGPLLLRLPLVVTGNDNGQTGSDPHLWDVSERNWRIHQMLWCQCSDLGGHCPSRPSTGSAKNSQLQRHSTCLHWSDKDAKVSLRKGWWQTGERTKIEIQQSHEIWVSTSLETERSTFQTCTLDTRLNYDLAMPAMIPEDAPKWWVLWESLSGGSHWWIVTAKSI